MFQSDSFASKVTCYGAAVCFGLLEVDASSSNRDLFVFLCLVCSPVVAGTSKSWRVCVCVLIQEFRSFLKVPYSL